jgi:hypothetical protein
MEAVENTRSLHSASLPHPSAPNAGALGAPASVGMTNLFLEFVGQHTSG